MRRRRDLNVSMNTTLCDDVPETSRHSSMRFQWSLYLLRCVDHANVVPELQRSQDGGEDRENKGSRHCLKAEQWYVHEGGEHNPTPRLADIMELWSFDPRWHHQPHCGVNLNFPSGPDSCLHDERHLSGHQARPSVYIPGRYFICSWQLASEGDCWWLVSFNLLTKTNPPWPLVCWHFKDEGLKTLNTWQEAEAF